MRTRTVFGLVLLLSLTGAMAPVAHGAETPDPEETAIDQTPPRLGFVDGLVSFWRPGAQDWVQAQVNTPLAPGDQLSTGSPGNLEVQIGARAFVRAGANTQLGLENQEPDLLQFKMTGGQAAFDVRALEAGHTVEVDTPNAAFTIEQPGYYRVDVARERTSFITRRAGRATVIPPSGEAVVIAASEEVVIEGTASPQIASFVAPPLDAWDQWNYARTDALLDAVSARYVSPGTYGVDDLDQHGTWRVVDPYGPVWVPTGVPGGWAPYSTGAWVQDPSYGWTWVDTAPWGWAPYHHGRWVFVNGFWGWAPGPVVVRPVYAPALVAFLGGPSVGVSVGIGGPVVGWVALGWGEPVVPWWGRPGFIHRPWWGGWGGPRVVNNVVITRTTVVHAEQITVYRNTHVRNGPVVVHENRFGRGRITGARVTQVDVARLQPIHTAPQIAATPSSFVPSSRRGIRPPEERLRRPVVATRPPHRWGESASGTERNLGPAGVPPPPPRLVTAPPRREPASVPPRPHFGQSTIERPMADRPRPPAAPRREGPPGPAKGAEAPPPVSRQASPPSRPEPKVATPSPAAPPTPAPGAAAPPSAGRAQPPSPQTLEGARRPEKGPEGPPPVSRQASPPSRPEPQAPSTMPAAPQPPAARATTPSPPAAQALPPSPSPQKLEGGRRPEKGPGGPPPVSRPASPPSRPEPKVATPSPAAPAPPAGGVTAPPPPASRTQAPRARAQRLPGEPANRLAPNRAERQQPERGERRESPPPGRPQGGPGSGSRERPGG
ncbi:MAG TPA: DUF6600 domain-containing protein [Candidatus Methylomirabilis sp.]|nr:DUF6600 domain-containing protein [Candidatus Methylomirabilis sp.]